MCRLSLHTLTLSETHLGAWGPGLDNCMVLYHTVLYNCTECYTICSESWKVCGLSSPPLILSEKHRANIHIDQLSGDQQLVRRSWVEQHLQTFGPHFILYTICQSSYLKCQPLTSMPFGHSEHKMCTVSLWLGWWVMLLHAACLLTRTVLRRAA